MNLIPDEDNNDEFMNANAEDWSKPSQPVDRPEPQREPTDRWGSPTSDKSTLNDGSRWRSEPIKTDRPGVTPSQDKPKSKWWVIAIIIVALLCLCVCAAGVGLSYFGVNLFNNISF